MALTVTATNLFAYSISRGRLFGELLQLSGRNVIPTWPNGSDRMKHARSGLVRGNKWTTWSPRSAVARVTGLPLVFGEQIAHLTGAEVEALWSLPGPDANGDAW